MNQMNRIAGKNSGLHPLIKGTISAIILCLFFLTISAIIINRVDLTTTAITIIGFVILGTMCLLGGFISARAAGNRGLVAGATLGLIIFSALLITGTILHGLSFHWITVGKGITCLITGSIGGVWGVNRSAKNKMK